MNFFLDLSSIVHAEKALGGSERPNQAKLCQPGAEIIAGRKADFRLEAKTL